MGEHIQLIEVGNKSRFGEIKIKEVLVNNDMEPTNAKLQVSNPIKGFIVSDRFDGVEEAEYEFRDFDSETLQKGNTPSGQIAKLRDGTARVDDEIYAITIGHKNSIKKVTIRYSHLGISHEKSIAIR